MGNRCTGGGELSISIINVLNNIIRFSPAAALRLNAHNESVSATDCRPESEWMGVTAPGRIWTGLHLCTYIVRRAPSLSHILSDFRGYVQRGTNERFSEIGRGPRRLGAGLGLMRTFPTRNRKKKKTVENQNQL